MPCLDLFYNSQGVSGQLDSNAICETFNACAGRCLNVVPTVCCPLGGLDTLVDGAYSCLFVCLFICLLVFFCCFRLCLFVPVSMFWRSQTPMSHPEQTNQDQVLCLCDFEGIAMVAVNSPHQIYPV